VAMHRMAQVILYFGGFCMVEKYLLMSNYALIDNSLAATKIQSDGALLTCSIALV
jgi:hypothetical protein